MYVLDVQYTVDGQLLVAREVDGAHARTCMRQMCGKSRRKRRMCAAAKVEKYGIDVRGGPKQHLSKLSCECRLDACRAFRRPCREAAKCVRHPSHMSRIFA